MDSNTTDNFHNGIQPASREEMQKRRKQLGYSYTDLAELSGLPLGTIQKVLGGFSKAPRYKTLAALDKVLFPEKYMGKKPGGYTQRRISETTVLHNGIAAYGSAVTKEQLAVRAKKKAHQLINQLPGDSVEALIEIMIRMLPGGGEDVSDISAMKTPKMQAFLDMQAMRRLSASYDISKEQRERAVDGKFGILPSDSFPEEDYESTT